MSEYLLSIGFITLSFFTLFIASKIFQKSKGFPLLHPLITASISLIAFLSFTDIKVETYLVSTELLIYLLAPATVALGVPLYSNFKSLMVYKWQLFLPLVAGAILSPLTAIGFLLMFDVDVQVLNSMVSKAITSPIAIDITKLLNGVPALAVLFVLVSGIIGAAFATSLFSLLKVENDISKGVAIGVSAHAIGTARAVQISEQCAAFSVIAMCLNGVTTAVLVVAYVNLV